MLPDVLLYRKEEVLIKTYDDCYLSFTNDYARSNPMTRNKGFEIYLAILYENKQITEERYRRLVKLLESKNMDIMDDFFKFNFANHIMLKTFGKNIKNQELQLNLISSAQCIDSFDNNYNNTNYYLPNYYKT